MAICPACVPWNLPLHNRQIHTVEAGYVPLRYQDWLIYRLHVEHHQRDNWSGEIDALSELLRRDPAMTLEPLQA